MTTRNPDASPATPQRTPSALDASTAYGPHRDPVAAQAPGSIALWHLLIAGVTIGTLVLIALAVERYQHAQALANVSFAVTVTPLGRAGLLPGPAVGTDDGAWTVQVVIANAGPAAAAPLRVHLALMDGVTMTVDEPVVVASDPSTRIRHVALTADLLVHKHPERERDLEITPLDPHERVSITLRCVPHGATATSIARRYQQSLAVGGDKTSLLSYFLESVWATGNNISLTRTDAVQDPAQSPTPL